MTPPPATTPGGTTITMSQEQLTLLISTITEGLKDKSKTTVTFDDPRVGGTTDLYVWTGKGAPGSNGSIPASKLCARDFDKAHGSKNYTNMSGIELSCQAPIPGYKLSLPGEPDANRTMIILRNALTCMEQQGMDAIFDVVLEDGSTLNIPENPGRFTLAMANYWSECLTTKGVPDGQGGRLTVCKYDIMNNDWSGHAFLSTCTDLLRIHVEDSLKAHKKPRTGVFVLLFILKKCYRPSPEKVKDLTDKLEAMDLRKFPGENVTLFVQEATRLLTEIKMNLTMENQCPTLLNSALQGLAKGTDVFFVNEVKRISITSTAANTFTSAAPADPLPSTVQVEEKLDELEELYQRLMERKSYDPGRQTPAPDSRLQALQAQITQLQQDRSARSTTGNSSNGGTGGTGSKDGCHHCGAPDHFKKHCPLYRKEQNLKVSGLTEDEWKELTTQMKAKEAEIKNWSHIPDDANLVIMMKGKVVAKGCRNCKRYTRGTSMHSTVEHKGRNKVPYKAPDGASAPAPGPGPALSASLAHTPAPAPRVSFADNVVSGPMLRASPRTTYDFSNMPVTNSATAGGNLAAADLAGGSNSWWDVISGDYSSYLKG